MSDHGSPNGVVAKLELVRAICGLALPAYETRTLVALATLINERAGCAFPARSLLASLVKVDDRHLGRALKGLQRRGLVSVSRGSRGRASEYRIDPEAVLAAIPASTGGSHPPLEAVETRLYRRVRPASRGGGNPPLEEAQEQLRASEAQAKQQSKLPASRSARARSPEARAHASARQAGKRNTWVANYRGKKPAEAAD